MREVPDKMNRGTKHIVRELTHHETVSSSNLALLSRNTELLSTLIIAGCFIFLVLPLSLHQVTDFMIFCIIVMSWDLLYGYMGRLSFGLFLYYGAGAYGTGLFVKYVSVNPLVAIVAGIMLSVVLAMLLGIVVVRATGASFALLNAAFNVVGYFIVMSPLRSITSGEDGFGVGAKRLGFINFFDPGFKFWFVLLSLLLVLWVLRRLIFSSYGVLVRSIKQNETRVRFLGYNTFFYKWITFIISASIAGLAGALSALNYNYVNPNSLNVHANVGVIFACLIGGAGHIYGAIIGGVIYMIISNLLPIYFRRWELFLGIALLIIVFRFKAGIWGSLKSWWTNRSLRRRQATIHE